MKITAILLLYLPLALTHPGHEEPEHQLTYKRQFNAHVRRGLDACREKLTRRGILQQAEERRAATVKRYRKAYNMHARDTDTVINTSHLSNQSYTPDTAETTIFESSNTCVVNPEGETGPYWVKGEYIRSNLRESQTGIPIVIEGQFLDIETCSPLTNVWWDIWNCNATGVYGGVVEQGNGNTADAANINATFLRGIQQADSDGVVTFETIFPGHYSGRTTHHHMVVHLDATVADNNTLVGGTYAHVGQVFWDQDLIDKVEATSPYNTNTVAITKNADDRVFSTETADTTSDPVFEYVYLGDDLSDGLFGWITVAVNTSATYDPNYSFALTSGGGVTESGGTMSLDGGSGNGGTTGGPPSGNSTTGGGGPSGNGTLPGGIGGPGSNGTVSIQTGSSTSPASIATSANSTGSSISVSTGSASSIAVSTSILTASVVGAIGSVVSAMAFSTLSVRTSSRKASAPTGHPGDQPHSRPGAGPTHRHHSNSDGPFQPKPSDLDSTNIAVPVDSQPTAAAPTVACSA